MSVAKANFSTAMGTVSNLLEIHRSLGGDKQGKRSPKLEALNKAGIVFVTACWESYIEDILIESATHISKNLPDVRHLPKRCREATAASLKGDPKDVCWKLAGDGWKTEYILFVGNKIKNFNTPSRKNVDDLAFDTIGIEYISSTWRWRNAPNDKVKKTIDEYIETRHELAHGKQTSDTVHKNWVNQFGSYIEGAAEKTDKAVSDYVKKLTGSPLPG